jgi:hypothetical protein
VSGEEEGLKRVVRAKPFVDEAVSVYLGTLEVLVAVLLSVDSHKSPELDVQPVQLCNAHQGVGVFEI